jgi:hypothetical protein
MSWAKIDEWSIYAMTLGQLAFLAMWGVLPWWREWIGRAMMLKSAALGLLLALGSIALLWGPADWQPWAMRAARILVLVGIWAQATALRYEERVAKRESHRRESIHREG